MNNPASDNLKPNEISLNRCPFMGIVYGIVNMRRDALRLLRLFNRRKNNER